MSRSYLSTFSLNGNKPTCQRNRTIQQIALLYFRHRNVFEWSDHLKKKLYLDIVVILVHNFLLFESDNVPVFSVVNPIVVIWSESTNAKFRICSYCNRTMRLRSFVDIILNIYKDRASLTKDAWKLVCMSFVEHFDDDGRK